jgi:hypothetical protein
MRRPNSRADHSHWGFWKIVKFFAEVIFVLGTILGIIAYARSCKKENAENEEAYRSLFTSDNSIKNQMQLQVCRALVDPKEVYCPIKFEVDASIKEKLSDLKIKSGFDVVLSKLRDFNRDCPEEKNKEVLKGALISFLYLIDRMPESLMQLAIGSSSFYPYDPWPHAKMDFNETYKSTLNKCQNSLKDIIPTQIGPSSKLDAH